MRDAVRQTRFRRPRSPHRRRSWIQRIGNGDLLRAASGTYNVLVTVDQNIPYQQNVAGLNIAIVVLAAKRNSYARLRPLMARASEALDTIKSGDVIRIEE